MTHRLMPQAKRYGAKVGIDAIEIRE